MITGLLLDVRERPDRLGGLRAFYLRRLLRIAPAYYVMLAALVSFVTVWFMDDMAGRAVDSPRDTQTATRAELLQIEAQLAEREADKRMHDELHRAYADLRTELNLQLRPELSELASAFLTEVELDDKYRIVVLEDGIPKPVISGGEEDLANLVLRLAISQMIAERAGQSFSLLVLDEIFGSLDDTRRQNVVELLRGLQDRFEQVILITHIEGVRDGLDQVIEVTFDPNSGAATVRRGASAPVGVEAL